MLHQGLSVILHSDTLNSLGVLDSTCPTDLPRDHVLAAVALPGIQERKAGSGETSVEVYEVIIFVGQKQPNGSNCMFESGSLVE